MKRFFALFAIIFAFYANLFAPNVNVTTSGDTLDKALYESNNDYWYCSPELRDAIREHTYLNPLNKPYENTNTSKFPDA